MQGQILDYSIQTNGGVIRGDDGNRYAFTGASWQAPSPPRLGMRVDFDPDGATAAGIYAITGNSPGSAAPRPAAATLAGGPAPYSGTIAPISTLGIWGMVAGLLAIVFLQTALLGFPLMVAGWALSITGLVTGRSRGEQVGFAVAGIVLSTIPFVINVIVAVVVSTSVNAIYGDSGGVFKTILSQILPIL